MFGHVSETVSLSLARPTPYPSWEVSVCPLRGWWEKENGAKRKEKSKDGGGGEGSVLGEEANLGLDVREKVSTTHDDGPSGLWESCWTVDWFVQVDTHRLLNCHFVPQVINEVCTALNMQPSDKLYPQTGALFLSCYGLPFVIDANIFLLLWNDELACSASNVSYHRISILAQTSVHTAEDFISRPLPAITPSSRHSLQP